MLYVCLSIYHIKWPSNAQKSVILTMQDVVQYQLGFDHPDKLKNLVSETWNAAVLDSGATNTVPGKICFICYINPLRPAL